MAGEDSRNREQLIKILGFLFELSGARASSRDLCLQTQNISLGYL